MEREQIIKALEYCKSPKLTKCNGCPREQEDGHCMYRLNEDALSLIKELTEEVESLKQCMEHEHTSFMETFGELDDKCKRLTEENEYLKQQNEIYAVLNEKMECICNSYVFQYGTVIPKEVFLKKEREKAVKEMQERLKSLLKTDYINGTREHALSVIDQIAKEMIGEGND